MAKDEKTMLMVNVNLIACLGQNTDNITYLIKQLANERIPDTDQKLQLTQKNLRLLHYYTNNNTAIKIQNVHKKHPGNVIRQKATEKSTTIY
eukprot:TRINITY_DN5303_c0_g3_i1.p2 TRINITY_DN5303_c0_g3~~TRINITY_DN5303_c0_g3_i1.p2  ORF type:complete len:100 (-),score=1.55 TRINITY_DN5303_c0_g3_i1:261-536(-)